MKKILLIISMLFLLTGCVNINNLDYKTIIETNIDKNINNKYYNQYHDGYKYYLPKYMNVKNKYDLNEKINGKDYTYYLYIDLISYYNNINNKSEANNSYISYAFNKDGKNGYLEVTQSDSKYLVEIMYNYAKIEVRVDKIHINEAINNGIIILSTIKYDKDIIKNNLGKSGLNNKEEELNIFENNSKKENFLDIIEEYDTYDEDIPDYDVIN